MLGAQIGKAAKSAAIVSKPALSKALINAKAKSIPKKAVLPKGGAKPIKKALDRYSNGIGVGP